MVYIYLKTYKKMKKVLFGIIVIIALITTACGNKKLATEQKADSTEVKVEVVDSTTVK